uniref:SH3 domain-containing protein n=1 Tax=Panagrellus redivivus TaxID=6233 RepID=A0A7E4UL90_PANRE
MFVVTGPATSLIHQDSSAPNLNQNGHVDTTTAPSTAASLEATDMGTKQARVVMDYEAVSPQELTVRMNDVLIVYRLPGLDTDFVMAEKGGRRGRVPLSYLEIL